MKHKPIKIYTVTIDTAQGSTVKECTDKDEAYAYCGEMCNTNFKSITIGAK